MLGIVLIVGHIFLKHHEQQRREPKSVLSQCQGSSLWTGTLSVCPVLAGDGPG